MSTPLTAYAGQRPARATGIAAHAGPDQAQDQTVRRETCLTRLHELLRAAAIESRGERYREGVPSH